MKFSEYLSRVEGSATAKIFAEATRMEANGKHIYHLEIGQPDFLPLPEILETTSQSVLAGQTQYTVSNGIPELRKSVSQYYSQFSVEPLDYQKNTVITAGGKLAIYATAWSYLNPGDNAIILNPSWVSYADIVEALGGEVRFLAVNEDSSFDESELRSKIDSKTKLLFINTPSNPTGSIISHSNLQKLYDICAEYGIIIISDEMYNEYVYEGYEFHSLGKIKGWMDNAVIVSGLSKTFSMTGFRLGYALGNQEIISSINKVNQLTASCPVNFAQHAGVVAYANIEKMRQKIKEIMYPRRQLVCDILEEMDLPFNPPHGAFYAWLKLDGVTNSIEFGKNLLAKTGVAITPGRAFGPDGEGYIRLSFATDEDTIKTGFSLLRDFLNS